MKKQIGGVKERLCLLGDDPSQAGMGVAQGRDTDTREQIEILAPLGVEKADPRSADER